MHRYQELGELQLPILYHEMEQGIWLGVVGDSDVLQKSVWCSAPALGFVSVRGERGYATGPNKNSLSVSRLSMSWALCINLQPSD